MKVWGSFVLYQLIKRQLFIKPLARRDNYRRGASGRGNSETKPNKDRQESIQFDRNGTESPQPEAMLSLLYFFASRALRIENHEKYVVHCEFS